ncbi:hypothetical protein Q1695_003576 [Nippostrongylus brasiliensis]|nr:hypothetical protein Q1695_003576 [Nippostrongylus brasiliensis]
MRLEYVNYYPVVRSEATIPIEKGVRQGVLISRKLFTAALQDAVENLDWDAKGYPLDGKRISDRRFADDIMLISISAEAEEMLSELSMAGRKIGLDMNMSKTQLMVNQWCDTGLVKLNGVALQRVDSYVYLGRELNMENDLAPEIACRRRAARAAFSSIREVTDQVKDAGLRASLFNASVLPATQPKHGLITKPSPKPCKPRIVLWRDAS